MVPTDRASQIKITSNEVHSTFQGEAFQNPFNEKLPFSK